MTFLTDKGNLSRIGFVNVKSIEVLFLRRLMTYKKTIMLLAILALLAPVLLPYGFSNSNKAVKNNLVSHAKLCCCNKVASTCSDCCCSDGLTETDDTSGNTVTITACCGTSDDIITVSKLNYLSSLSVIVNHMPVATLAKTIIPGHKGVLFEPPYKPPKPQLLTHFI